MKMKMEVSKSVIVFMDCTFFFFFSSFFSAVFSLSSWRGRDPERPRIQQSAGEFFSSILLRFFFFIFPIFLGAILFYCFSKTFLCYHTRWHARLAVRSLVRSSFFFVG